MKQNYYKSNCSNCQARKEKDILPEIYKNSWKRIKVMWDLRYFQLNERLVVDAIDAIKIHFVTNILVIFENAK